MRSCVLILFLLATTPALGDYEPTRPEMPSREESEGRYHFEGRVYYGSTFWNGSAISLLDSSNNPIDTERERDSATSQTGYEIGIVNRNEHFGIFLEMEINRYAYGASDVTDGQTGVSLSPRFYFGTGRIRPWLGCGFGLLFISFGGPTTEQENGVNVTQSDSMVSFELTPRLGVDVSVAGPLFLSAQLGINGSAGFMSATATTKTQSETFTVELQRYWWQGNLGIGVRL